VTLLASWKFWGEGKTVDGLLTCQFFLYIFLPTLSSMEQKDSADQPATCIGGCGFYGNKIYNGMCSKCFKESQAQLKEGKLNLHSLDESHHLIKHFSMSAYDASDIKSLL
jgi:A20-like zinc finger